ncbi:DUF397 domain-containing protein [Streptomyces sp. DASNCL29]|uniref:DUF397 domain-containing protein n=1 Tax=Streptomyces sp. DASNCL29 TaxID=2583819 RepID=UPI00110F9654|nr:DUF397 domain-containing protein [Streptomyces sp. DASNCL29]TMU97432.1 DUF397 domain-containing protein [Streptomyces sp. DASNCL29]
MHANRSGWFKSSYSGQNGGCVEARFGVNGVGCRDSKDPEGPALLFERDAWQAFVNDVKAGRYPALGA